MTRTADCGKSRGACAAKPSCEAHLARRRAKYASGDTAGRSRSHNQERHLAGHGLTVEQYDQVLLEQGGGCAVCGATEPGGRWGRFHIDHDHEHCPGFWGCGDCVRGLLCNNCNMGIGFLGDDAARLRAAAQYLERTREVSDAEAHLV